MVDPFHSCRFGIGEANSVLLGYVQCCRRVVCFQSSLEIIYVNVLDIRLFWREQYIS